MRKKVIFRFIIVEVVREDFSLSMWREFFFPRMGSRKINSKHIHIEYELLRSFFIPYTALNYHTDGAKKEKILFCFHSHG